MRIGIIIGRIGDVDGVALETEKWIEVLQRMGHEIFIMSGRFKRSIVGEKNETIVPSLSFFSPQCEWEQKRAFFYPDEDPSMLINHLEYESDIVAIQIFKWMLKKKIDVILSENASALPCHLSMGMGIKKAVERTGIPLVTHDHDFAWERGDRYKTPHKPIREIIDTTFPINSKGVKHAVINTPAKHELRKMVNIDSIVVPNVMDFNEPYGEIDNYNSDLLQHFGFKKNIIPMFQITRIVRRKGIETAIELVDRLNDNRIRLIITGSAADDERFGYYKVLKEMISQRKLEDKVHFAHHHISPFRGKSYDGGKIYSLSDAYAHSAACTYFSTYEGFGNAFVECILAKKPIFVNNYKPVYWPDIGSKGFKTVMLEDNNLTDDAVEEAREILTKPDLQKEIAEYNFNLGKKHFSYEVLEEKLSELFDMKAF